MSSEDESNTTAEGAAFPWILEHLLTYPGTYEIPLRTMYTLNSTTQQHNPSSSDSAPVNGNAFPSRPVQSTEKEQLSTETAAAQLRANLMTHISQQPTQPCSLPPSFVISFVRKCFTVELEQVDFPQALTALDYLKDLEVRRRREVAAALQRLGVDREDLREKEKLGKKYPGVLRWVSSIEEKERKVEALYTQVYLGIRRWQRNGFFRYITGVQKQGTGILSALIADGKRPGEDTGWTAVRDTVERYLRSANQIIDECFEVNGRDSLLSTISEESEESHRRKVDSGISFSGSSTTSSRHRPSTSGSTTSSSRASKRDSREKALSDIQAEESKPEPHPTKPAGSTLERIARELKKIRSRGDLKEGAQSRADRNDEESTQMQTYKEKKVRLRPSLRKMKSASTLGEKDTNKGDGQTFDVDEMKRQRLLWEANQRKGKLHKPSASDDIDRGRMRSNKGSMDSIDAD
ncbi:MAG: hypothetical protein Q9160_000289 [Pyrenula sp. 1 TL-2023]